MDIDIKYNNMIEDLIKYVQEEIGEAREFFIDDEHFNEVFEQAGWNEEEMRIFDCGYIKGLQNALNKLQEYGEQE